MLRILTTILLLFETATFHLNSQVHLIPQNGGDGVSAGITGSFRIAWERIDSALNYEYVLSDNPLCFSGCPGDTRQEKTSDTTSIEYNLVDGKWYYWITRIYYENGDTSNWTPTTSFLANYPPEKSFDQFVEVFPNPVAESIVEFRVNWDISPSIASLTYELYDLSGKNLVPFTLLERDTDWIENISLVVNKGNLQVAVMEIRLGDNLNNPNNIIRKRIVFQ